MPNKLSDTNDGRYKSLGFESTFDGSAGGIQWSELVEDLKTNNVLRQNLRVRKLILGEYTTTVAGKDMAKVPVDADSWDATVKRQVSLALQDERKADLIHKGRSASEIEKDTYWNCFIQVV